MKDIVEVGLRRVRRACRVGSERRGSIGGSRETAELNATSQGVVFEDALIQQKDADLRSQFKELQVKNRRL